MGHSWFGSLKISVLMFNGAIIKLPVRPVNPMTSSKDWMIHSIFEFSIISILSGDTFISCNRGFHKTCKTQTLQIVKQPFGDKWRSPDLSPVFPGVYQCDKRTHDIFGITILPWQNPFFFLNTWIGWLVWVLPFSGLSRTTEVHRLEQLV